MWCEEVQRGDCVSFDETVRVCCEGVQRGDWVSLMKQYECGVREYREVTVLV